MVLPPSSSLQSLVPSSSLPPSLWCHGSLAPGGEGRREEGMLGRRDGRREEGRGCVGCCHLFPSSYHHSADKQSTYLLLPGKKNKCPRISFGLKLLVAEANGVSSKCQKIRHFLGRNIQCLPRQYLVCCVPLCVSVLQFTQWQQAS